MKSRDSVICCTETTPHGTSTFLKNILCLHSRLGTPSTYGQGLSGSHRLALPLPPGHCRSQMLPKFRNPVALGFPDLPGFPVISGLSSNTRVWDGSAWLPTMSTPAALLLYDLARSDSVQCIVLIQQGCSDKSHGHRPPAHQHLYTFI